MGLLVNVFSSTEQQEHIEDGVLEDEAPAFFPQVNPRGHFNIHSPFRLLTTFFKFYTTIVLESKHFEHLHKYLMFSH